MLRGFHRSQPCSWEAGLFIGQSLKLGLVLDVPSGDSIVVYGNTRHKHEQLPRPHPPQPSKRSLFLFHNSLRPLLVATITDGQDYTLTIDLSPTPTPQPFLSYHIELSLSLSFSSQRVLVLVSSPESAVLKKNLSNRDLTMARNVQ